VNSNNALMASFTFGALGEFAGPLSRACQNAKKNPQALADVIAQLPPQTIGTALLMSATCNYFGAVDQLLDRGADINAMEKGWTALLFAVNHQQHAMAAHLLERGADVNLCKKLDWLSPLNLAAIKCDGPMIEILLKWGAKIVSSEKSALDLARSKGGKGDQAAAMIEQHMLGTKTATNPERSRPGKRL
jgi:ankyrin repeat protein